MHLPYQHCVDIVRHSMRRYGSDFQTWKNNPLEGRFFDKVIQGFNYTPLPPNLHLAQKVEVSFTFILHLLAPWFF